jgi:hypothetical protein
MAALCNSEMLSGNFKIYGIYNSEECSLKLARVWHNYVQSPLLYYTTVRSLH